MRTISKLASLLAISAMMGSGYESPVIIDGRRSYKGPPKLNNYKHKGDIPKGCQIEIVTLEFTVGNYKVMIDVDLVYGTKKGREKKLIKYTAEIKRYVGAVSLQSLISDNKFKVVKIWGK